MPKFNRAKIAAGILVLVLSCFSVVAARRILGPHGKLFADKRATSRAKGNPNAPLWVVEYVDFQCQACRRAGPLMKEYFEKHPSEIYLQVRFHPLVKTHLHAFKSALYAECAARQGKFWPFHDALFDGQDAWSTASDPDALFRIYANFAGMDLKKLDACLAHPTTKEAVMKEKDASVDLGVKSTPTFFVNGEMIVGVERLKENLDKYFADRAAAPNK